MYAGDWILSLLGTTVWVGSFVALGGAGAIVLALVRIVSGASGLASGRSIPPFGVTSHAEEVRRQLRARYLARAARVGIPYVPEASDAPAAAPMPMPTDDPFAVLVAERASLAITRLPPLNESLRRGLSARVPKQLEATPPPRRRKARRKARRTGTRARKRAAA